MRPLLPRSPHAILAWGAGLLALTAIVALLVLDLGLLAFAWTAVGVVVVVACLGLRLAPAGLRVFLAVLLIPILILLTFEGGLFFVPAAIALVIAQLVDSRSTQSGPTRDAVAGNARHAK
jgi:hypothetical protein